MMTDAEWEEFEAGQYGGPQRTKIMYRFRVLLRRMQGKICPICGERIEGNSGSISSIDHVIPRRAGGADLLGNFLCAHVECNHKKGHRMPTGCELIWLLAVNARLGVGPQKW